MALPALLGAGAKAVGGSMVKAGGRAAAGKVLGRGKKKQLEPARIVPVREGVDGGKGSAIIKPKVKMVSAKEIKSLQTGDAVSPGKDPLKSIYSNVIIIEKILKGTLAAEKDQQKQQKKDDKKGDREAQEKKLETKTPNPEKKTLKMPKVPGMGIFGFIKNFIGNVILGYFAVRLVKFLPQMLELLKGLGKVVDFVTDVGMFLVDGVASFINFAYNVYDGTRNLMKKVGGDALMGAFDGIMKAVEVAITVLTFALGAKSLGGFGDSRGGGKGKGKSQTKISGPKGNLLGSQDKVTSSSAARRYANRFGRDAAEKRFGKDAVSGLGGKFGRSRTTNFARGAATGVAKKLGGRGGVKMLASLGKIGKFLKVPVIGSIISVVLSLMAGDPIQKALFKGVGSAVGGVLGGLLSSAIGVPPLGLFLGGIIGDYVGDLLYTLFFGGGLKAAGSKLVNDVKGMFTGIGDGAKAIFSWIFGGGLLNLLKNVGGGLLKFALYTLNPGGLLWDIIKTTGAAYKAVFDFIFGGGLFDLIKNVSGGVLKFVGYVLNPGGLIFDALKAGGAAAKMIIDFAKSIVGNVVGGAVEGTKRATGGFFDALTFNLFDFDKQNKVETKKKGGGVGRDFQKDTISAQKKAIRKKPSYEKIKVPEGGKIKTGKKTERAYWDFLGWAGTGGEDETVQLGSGGMMLANRVANVGNSFGDHPYFGPILSLAAKVILGQTPDEQEYKNVGYGLNMLVGDGINKGKINEGIKGYEDGGLVKDAMAGVDISRWATDTFRKELSETLYKNFDKKSSDGSTSGPGTTPGVRDSATGELQDRSAGGSITMGSDFESTLAKLLKNYEGLRTQAYLDSVGIPTIGMGATYYPKGFRLSGDVKMGQTITEEEALFIKQQHIKEHRDRLLRELPSSTYNKVPDNVKAALESKVFNYGSLGSTLTDLVATATEDDNYKPVSDYFRNSLAGHDGGINSWRRNDEAGLIDTGTSSRAGLSFPKQSGSKAAEVYKTAKVNVPSLPDEPGNTDTSGSGNISASGSGVVAIGKDLISKGFSVAEHPDFTKTPTSSGGAYTPGKGSVSNVHKGAGHYDGRAIDVTDWRGSLADSKARYRSVLTSLQDNPAINMLIHDSWGGMYAPGQKQGPGAHGHPTHMHIETKRSHAGTKLSNREQMLKILPGQSLLDENSSKALGASNLARFNAASTPEEIQNIAGQIAGVSDYAPYEQGAQQTVMVQDPPQQQMPESPSSSGGGMMIVSGGSSHDPFEFLDYQG